MRFFKYITLIAIFVIAFSSAPLYPAETCRQLLDKKQEKHQEISILEATIGLQEKFQPMQASLDGLKKIADVATRDPKMLAEKIEELLLQALEAHGSIENLVAAAGESLEDVPALSKRTRDATRRVSSAGRDLRHILNNKGTTPVERLRWFGDYTADARLALNPLVPKVPFLRTSQSLYYQANDSATALVFWLEDGDEDFEQLLRESGPYGDVTLYPQANTPQRRLMARLRKLYRDNQDLVHRSDSKCVNLGQIPKESALEKKIDLARTIALEACEGADSERLQDAFQRASLLSQNLYRKQLAAERISQNTRAQFSKRFAPALELQQINGQVARYQLAVKKRLQVVEDFDQEIDNMRRQEQTVATQSFIRDRLAQKEREVARMDKVRVEIQRLKKLRERHFRMRGFAVDGMRQAAERLQQAMTASLEALATAERAECEMDRCERAWWLAQLPSLDLNMEEVRKILPALLHGECEAP